MNSVLINFTVLRCCRWSSWLDPGVEIDSQHVFPSEKAHRAMTKMHIWVLGKASHMIAFFYPGVDFLRIWHCQMKKDIRDIRQWQWRKMVDNDKCFLKDWMPFSVFSLKFWHAFFCSGSRHLLLHPHFMWFISGIISMFLNHINDKSWYWDYKVHWCIGQSSQPSRKNFCFWMQWYIIIMVTLLVRTLCLVFVLSCIKKSNISLCLLLCRIVVCLKVSLFH